MILFFFLICIFTVDKGFTQEESCPTLTIDYSIRRLLECNRDILDARDSLARVDLSLERENNYFSWRISPDAMVGYGKNNDKQTDSNITYGIGGSLSKEYIYGQGLYLHPSLQKKKKGYQANISASFTQPLLRGFGKGYSLSRIYGAEFSKRSAFRAVFQKYVDMMLKTIAALYNVVKMQEIVKLNRELYDRLDKFLQATKLKEKIGIASAMDVYRVELEFKNTEDIYTTSIDQLKDAEDQLRELLAISGECKIEVSVPMEDLVKNFSLEQALDIALNNRIEIDQSEDTCREAKRLTQIAKKDLIPELNLVLDYTNSYSYDRFSDMSKNCDYHENWRVFFATSKNLDIYLDKSQFILCQLAVEQATRAKARTVDTITLDIKRAVRMLERTRKKIFIQQKQIASSEGSLKLSLMKFNKGLANNFDVMQAEKNLHQAKIQLFSSIIDLLINQVKLRASMGIFAEKPKIAC